MFRTNAYLVLRATSQWEDSHSSLTEELHNVSKTSLKSLALTNPLTLGQLVCRVCVVTDPLATLSPTHTKYHHSKENTAQQTHGQASPLADQIPLQAHGSSSVLAAAHPWVKSTLSSQHGDAHLSNPGWQCNCITHPAFTSSSMWHTTV